MLSYRHAYHAGNHADVLKHVVLVALLRALTQKDKALWVFDTHAGAGGYSLESGHARKRSEFKGGIGRLWSLDRLPELVADYVAQVRQVNPDGVLRHYPGSPQIAAQLLRPKDRLRCFELHSTDAKALEAHFANAGRQVGVVAGDGFEEIRALLPPPSRRGMVLIDPSYEVKTDYRATRAAVRDALVRFATGTYVVWYPMLARREAVDHPRELRRLAPGDWVDVALAVRGPSAEGFGMYGSGLFVLNPPWNLESALRPAVQFLARVLGEDSEAGFRLEFRQT